MIPTATTPAAAGANADPHAPKLAPDDPRLRLGRPRGARTLRAAPIVVILAVLGGAVMLAVALAFQPPPPRVGSAAEPSGAPPSPAVPDRIRNAPAVRPSPGPSADAGLAPRAMRAAAGDDPEVRAAVDIERRARGAGILFEQAPMPAEGPGPDLGSRAAAPVEPEGSSGASALSAAADPNGQDRKNAFLAGQGGVPPVDYLEAPLQHPRSPYEIQAGTIVPAVLLTAINSDLPGPVVAQVREHVYDTVTGETLLVPQGSRLIAQYDSRVAWGQERVLLCWNRLLLPNGDSIDLKCMPAADLKGAAGLTDEVDEHWWRILKGATVATLLATTGTVVAGDTTGYNPTVSQTLARNAAGEVGQVGQQLTRSNLNIQPTITVRPGFSVNVIVTKDMILPPYPDPPAALGLGHE
jgi:type IV secretion system protein VirB10